MSDSLFPNTRLETVTQLLRDGRKEWQALGVQRVRVFGSITRGEIHTESDIDLLVDFQEGFTPGLLRYMRIKETLEDLLRRRVDIMTEAALKHPLKNEILEDAVDVMEQPTPPLRPEREERWRWRVFDLLEALDRITEETSDLTLTTFLRNECVQDAALHNLMRIGETTKFIPQSIQDRNKEIPWPYLRDIRNLVAHNYFGIEPIIIWQTIQEEFPKLRPILQRLAES